MMNKPSGKDQYSLAFRILDHKYNDYQEKRTENVKTFSVLLLYVVKYYFFQNHLLGYEHKMACFLCYSNNAPQMERMHKGAVSALRMRFPKEINGTPASTDSSAS